MWCICNNNEISYITVNSAILHIRYYYLYCYWYYLCITLNSRLWLIISNGSVHLFYHYLHVQQEIGADCETEISTE